MRSVNRRPSSSAFCPISGLTPGQVDVVADDHQGPGAVGRVDAAGSVGQDDDPRPERAHEQHRLDDEARRVALVEVEPALEQDDRHALERSRGAAGRRDRARSPPASPAGRRTGMETGFSSASARPPSPEPSTIPIRGTRSVRARTAPTSAARRAGCSIGGTGRPRSLPVESSVTSHLAWGQGDSSADADERRHGASPVRREYRHRDAGHVSPNGHPPGAGNEAPEATVLSPGLLDVISEVRVSEAPSGNPNDTDAPVGRVNAVIHELAVDGGPLSTFLYACVDAWWTSAVDRPVSESLPPD